MAKQNVSLFDGTLVRVGNEVKRFDKGALIPDYADDTHVALLVERGMVGEGEPTVGLTHETVGPVAFNVDADAAEAHKATARRSGKES